MSSSATNQSATASDPNWRIAPSLPVAFGLVVAYIAVFIGLFASSGIDYPDAFDNGPNAFRAAVVPLIGGSALLIAFVWWARWDFVFRDPAQLPMHRSLRLPIWVFAVAIVIHFAIADWADTSASLVMAILAAGVLVGFAEETLFRGILLRALRTDGRAEVWVMLISSVVFGSFHVTNVFLGAAISGVILQCVLATASGVILYLFRRYRGMLLTGMVAHGLWDMSVFLPARTGTISVVNLALQVLVMILALVAVVVMMRQDRDLVVTRTGLETR